MLSEISVKEIRLEIQLVWEELWDNSAEEEGRVPAHEHFQDNNPVYGPLTQIDSQIQEIQDMQAENLAILTERYDNACIHGDQEEMLAIQDQMDWWTTVL